MRFAFIAKHQGIWPVAWLCEALYVSRSGFHARLNRGPSRRAQEDEVIGAEVRQASLPAPAPMVPGGCGGTCSPAASIAACIGSSD